MSVNWLWISVIPGGWGYEKVFNVIQWRQGIYFSTGILAWFLLYIKPSPRSDYMRKMENHIYIFKKEYSSNIIALSQAGWFLHSPYVATPSLDIYGCEKLKIMSDLFCLQKYKRKIDGTSWSLNIGFVLNKLINFHWNGKSVISFILVWQVKSLTYSTSISWVPIMYQYCSRYWEFKTDQYSSCHRI